MGEQVKQDPPKVEEAKPEEKTEEKKEAAKAEESPKPHEPFVLFVDLHCEGCARKIEKSIMRIRGVEEVVIDMLKNQVTIKGIIEPQAICNKIIKKTKRTAKVISPVPAAEGQLIASQVSELTTVELNVNMHCEACAEQLKRKILKMKGVRRVETELSSSKVTVTGTMDADKLVEYVYRRTKKAAKIVPQPEPEPAKPKEEPKSEKAAPEKPADEPKPEEKKEEGSGEKPPEEEKKEEGGGGDKPPEEKKGGETKEEEEMNICDEQSMQRMVYNYYQPLYMIERIPPPQLFSDENPNACSIS